MAEKRQQQDRLALQDGVALEFGAPRAVFLLLAEEPMPRAVDGPAHRHSQDLTLEDSDDAVSAESSCLSLGTTHTLWLELIRCPSRRLKRSSLTRRPQ